MGSLKKTGTRELGKCKVGTSRVLSDVEGGKRRKTKGF